MGDWTSQLAGWYGLAEQETAGLLKLLGQNNEVITLGAMVLLALVALALVWGLTLALLRGVFTLFGGGSGARTEPSRDFGGMEPFAGPAPRSPGALDIAPSAMAGPAAPRMGPGAERQAPTLSVPAGQEPRAAAPALPKRPPLAKAAGASLPAGREMPLRFDGPFQQVALKQLPRVADRGAVVSARPEWTGRVAPSSLQEAGAVEVCRVLSRRPSALAGSETVRAVDYRVCGLPRVSGEGRRQPDVMVYTVADRGFLPKTASAKQGRR